ncbi:MAG: hypothetical protein HYZ18_13940 [Pseudogulbenkiania sp.]|nr:hypothetical protein [Pseudogulbenkiania sp.]
MWRAMLKGVAEVTRSTLRGVLALTLFYFAAWLADPQPAAPPKVTTEYEQPRERPLP